MLKGYNMKLVELALYLKKHVSSNELSGSTNVRSVSKKALDKLSSQSDFPGLFIRFQTGVVV
jgi:hypothetical protein